MMLIRGEGWGENRNSKMRLKYMDKRQQHNMKVKPQGRPADLVTMWVQSGAG